MKQPLDIRCMGIDLSPNHSAFVVLDGAAKMASWSYVTNKPTHVKQGGTRLKLDKDKDKSSHQMERLVWWKGHLRKLMIEQHPTHVGIEDYAISMTGNNVYQIGELGGQARLAAISHGARLRLHDPASIKMYVAHSGNAKPEETLEAVLSRWTDTKAWSGLHNEVQLDLAPAYGVARMIFDEVQLRAGRVAMDSFHEKELQVWNRVTKTYPTNVLSRDWIEWRSGEA